MKTNRKSRRRLRQSTVLPISSSIQNFASFSAADFGFA